MQYNSLIANKNPRANVGISQRTITPMTTSNDTTILLNQNFITWIDTVDIDLQQYNWCALKGTSIYARARINKAPIMMHRLILERILNRPLNKDEYADHINGDGLDNRRSNLRLATRYENARNARLRKDSPFKLKGVTKDRDHWRARITVNKKQIYLGQFDNPEDAHKAYCEAAKIHHGEFARVE